MNYTQNPFSYTPSRLSKSTADCTNRFSSSDDHGSLQFRPNIHKDADDSGVLSPPLWKSSPSPPRGPSEPLLNHRRSLSPNSRIQAITRGQRELMEMVKNMPESSYELSLKDLVENQRIETEASDLVDQKVVVKVKRQESKKSDRSVMRIESFENKRVFLKMVIPFSLKSNKKKKFGSNSSGKVSPTMKADWWKMKFSGSTDSDGSNNSGSRGSSGASAGCSSRGNDMLRGCWPFIQSRSRNSIEE